MEQSSFPVSGDVNSTFPSNTSFDSENSDYSSDSSVASNSALVRRPAFTAPVTLSDGSMITAAATNHSQSDVVSAQPYKFFTYTPESDATQDPKTCEFLEREQVELCALKDLVCFSASELYDRAWLTADFNERCKSFPPFPILPQPPNVFGARFENTHNISHFLYHFTPFLLERNHAPTPVYLRTKLVELSLGEETLRMKQSLVSTSVNAVPQGPPDWETEAGEHKDLDEETSSEDDNTEVTPFDVGVALSHSTLMSQMPLDTVILLDKLVNRCIRRATMSMFHTWGIKRVTNILLRQVETLSTQTQPDIDWLSRAYSLIAKIVLSSGDVNKLLTIIRWNYQHPNVLRQLKVRGLRNLVNLIAWSDVARVRLPLPYNVPRGDVISYSHSLGSFINKIYAICACEEVEKPFVSVFADTGVYSISVRPPFEILHRNLSYSGEGCKGVYLKDGVFSVIRSSGVEFLSATTLEKMPQTVANPDADGEHFSLFTGSGRYLRPFVRAGGSPRRLRFKGSCGEGRVEPPNVVIPRGTDSITVQFSFYAYKPALTTKVEVVSILAGEKKWLSASVTMCPNKSTVTVLFEHGEDAFAEVEEPIKNGWVTWNASLVSLNEITSWTVYRNGLFCESRGKSGTLFTPSMPGVLDILAGSFFGFFSDVSVWCCPRRLTGEPDAPHAQSSSSSTSSSLPLFRFPLDEGVGFTVRSSCGECSWSSKLLQWEVPPESEKIVSGKESRRMEWKPSGDYYCVHNGFEVCVVEDDCATWVDAEGMIVEQNEVKIKPTDCCFYSLSTGKLYLVLPEVSSIRIVARICPASQSLEKKETLRSYQSFCVAFLSSLEDQKYSTGGAEFSQYIAYQISAYLLLEDSKNRASFFSFPSLNTPCVKTVIRLIVICNDVVEKIKCDAASGIDELHLCICGRLLVKQVKLLERTCPKTAISQIIDIYNYLSNLGPSKDKFLDEAVGVFVHLHNVMLSNCLSHDYQLQLLCDCSNLHGVRQLLTPGNVQQLVLSVIKYDFKKPFMTLLGKLKKMCEEEADNIFARRKTGYFEAAPALLSCVLGLLTQRESTQWHLVSVALFSSLCKNIVKGYEKAFESETDRRANTNLLKQTSLGALVYPVAHVLYSARFDASITLDILKVLGEARAALVPYYTTYVKPSVFKTQTSELVVSNETHVVLFPFNTTIPASATVDMSYGKSIVVEASEEARQACEIEVVLIATYSRHRLVEVLGDSDVRFDCGGLLTITVKGKELPFPICVNVHVEVERQRELDSSTDWLRDISHCLTHSIVNVATHAVEELRLNSPSSSEDFITKYSLFAGGLYANFTKVLSDPQHAATSAGKTRLPQVTAVRAKIIALSVNEESPLTALWHEQFNATAFPQRERLAELVRQCTCAILWFTVNPYTPQNWETEVVTVLNYLKRKSYLLLECTQQGRTPSIMSRVEFLLHHILPHFPSDDFSYANQFGDSSRPAQQSRTMSRRGASTSVSHSRPVEPLTLSIDPQRSTTSKVKADPLSAGKPSETTEESIANEILVFLRDETLEDTEQITEELNRRTLVCLILTATFKLKTAVCECNRDGVSLFLFSLTNHLQFLQRLSTRDGNTAATTASHEDTPHYLSCIKGCGIMIESECQRSGAAFFCAAVRQLVKRLGSEAHVCLQSIISLCSALAHPWDSKDFTVMPPSELFEFFSLSLQKVDEIMVALKSSEERFYNRKGFLHLLKRCMVLPNSLLQVAGDGIQIINGEVQGLQAENVNVICCARNNWKPQYGKAGKMKRRKGSDTDVYSNYGLSCVFTEVPDVLYFEITVDLCTNDAVRVTCGLSSVPLASTETELPDSCVYFSSDGYVTDGSAKRKKFSDPWVVGDVIGCGLLAPDNGIFFTRNGTFLGVAVESSFETFTPFVEAKAVGSLLKIIVNFGAEQPFKFDLASMHCSCRSDYLTPKLVSDAVLMCIHFFISNANTVFQEEYDSRKDGEREACAAILHAAAKFLSESVLTTVGEVNAMMGSHAESTDADTFALDYYLDKLGKLFQLLDSLVECFVYDSVGRATYAIVIDVCVTTLMRSREKSSRFRATHTFGLLLQMVDPASISATIVSQKISISAEEVVQCLSELARTNLVKGAAASSLPPQWANETSTVSGKGVFFGLQPLPAQGTTVIGFKLQRRQRGQGVGTPLGGCYYIGLCHGRPHIPNMGSLISRSDVYVLQDTDDHDQVQHLLLRRHSIPRNDNRRIFGNDEVVWVEFNADTGEITYYRDNMVLIGLAFANIQKVDDLYPIVYMFNEDASCELIHFPTSNQESSRQWLESFRRSLCVSTLQQMHLVPYFAPVISQFIYRHLSLLDRDLQSCMVALAVLGGERSYKYCLHDTFGLVVVVFIADVISKAVVYVATDVNKHLFSVPLRHLKPTFVKIPLHSSMVEESSACAGWLVKNLRKCISDAVVIAPLLHEERNRREQIEDFYTRSFNDLTR
ncbi:hypothetical protein AGDE_09143 [Angomonas deanei]|uniref:SPRY domain containing protein, putative n=1 Tax=Angomonas deanei TaxID=59799 RepID=A0A7G2CP07_9TRYP|nr:hypothetical protein AGDE_09143 [Angomonas deanei]CAD2221588.1 SPRY domain containing protein, putative [Angomonas deanei]|eukprot:EPY31259.1 hypothetical protein AGDE_09143 [Angomonas deanei]